jgi:hypothetical protein
MTMKDDARLGAASRRLPGPLHAALAAALAWTLGPGCGGSVVVECGEPPCPGAGNACEQAETTILAKYTGCDIDIPPSTGEPIECTPEIGAQSTCVAECVVAVSCETLTGEDPNGAIAFAECLGAC